MDVGFDLLSTEAELTMPNDVSLGVETDFARLIDDLADRRLRGETPNLDDYAVLHPELVPRLKQVAAILDLLPQKNEGVPELTGFRIVKELGRGGMGVVYEAVEDALGRRVALKALPLQAAARPQWLDRFRREAKAAARLHHTNIVPVFGIGEQNGVHYYVMQAIDGVSLEKRPVADMRQMATWGLKIAEALAHAHALGVLHRDIKPSNILIDEAGEPYLTDFGLAKLTDDVDLTESGDFIGTLRYASPEQLQGRCDERSDVYSLGATLYELLSGQPPFAAEDRGSLVRQIVEEEPRALRSVRPAAPRDLATIIHKAMAKEPARRYPTAAALADDLRRYLADQPVLARPVSSFERTSRWARRHPAIAGLSAAVAVLLLAVTGTALVGYVRTSDALEQSELHRIAAENAQAAESEERGRAERGEQDARQALAQTLGAIRKAHEIVDAIPSGYINLVMGQTRRGSVTPLRGRFEHEMITVERFIDLYEDFLRTPIPNLDARLEQVRSWRRLAYLYLEVGRRDDADRAYSSGVIAARDLSARGNRSPQLRLEVALASGYAGVSKSARRKDGSLELNFAFGELNALAAASPSDAAPLREHSELLNRYAAVIPNQNLKLKLFAEAIGFQRQALRLADTPASRNRLNLQYEEVFLQHRRADNTQAARETLQEWESIWPDWPEHALRIARTAGESLLAIKPPAIDDAELARWKRIAFENLVRYQRLGGTGITEMDSLARNRFFANDEDFQKLFQQLRQTPTAVKPK